MGGLRAFFKLPLARVEVNSSCPMEGQLADQLGDRAPMTCRTLELLEMHTAADASVYDASLEAAGLARPEVQRLRAAAPAEQLVLFGQLSAGPSRQPRAAAQKLARQRQWVDDIQASVSWRMTAPLRAAKHLTRIAHR